MRKTPPSLPPFKTIIDPDPTFARYSWQSRRSRERQAIERFLSLAEGRAELAPLPPPAVRQMLDWLRARLDLDPFDPSA